MQRHVDGSTESRKKPAQRIRERGSTRSERRLQNRRIESREPSTIDWIWTVDLEMTSSHEPTREGERAGVDEEKLGRLAEALSAVDAKVKPWQAEIKPGDLFRYPAADGHYIYCEVLPDRAYQGCLRNLRRCRCYTVGDLQGEICGVHISAVELLMSAEQFALARRQDWRL